MGLSALASLAMLAAIAAFGAAALRQVAPFLEPVERWVYGTVVGTVLWSVLLFLLAIPLGLTLPLVAGLTIGAGAAAMALGPAARSWADGSLESCRPILKSHAGRIALAIVVVFVAWLVCFWTGAITVDAEGLWVSQANLWADWAQHLGDVSAFAYGDNFPPTQTRFVGVPLAYHYLTSVTAAAMVILGMTPWDALALQSFVFSVVVALSVYAFARRMTGAKSASVLTAVLFLLGGGLGWTLSVADLATAQGSGDAVLGHLWNAGAQRDANFRWLNVYFSSIAPQRAYLYGLPLFALVITALQRGIETRDRGPFVIAGVVAGLLPLTHLGTMLALAAATPFMFLLLPRRGWVWFFAFWITIAVPQLFFQQGGTAGAISALRWDPGWVASPDPWVWFWLKNLGFFWVALFLGLADRSLVGAVERRILASFMVLFVVANLFIFQPWDWDNTKLLVFWYLAASVFVSAWLASAWQRFTRVLPRLGLLVMVATMLLSGAFQSMHQRLGFDRHRLLTADEIELSRRVRAETEPHAVFLTSSQHNHPIHVLAGRRVVMGYPGWLWSQGYDYADRERDVRAMFAMSPEADELMTAYGIDFVVVGPTEKAELEAAHARLRERYPVAIRTTAYEVFDVRRRIAK